MRSWASITKTAPVPASTTAQQPQQQKGDIFVLYPSKIRTKKNGGGGGAGAAATAAAVAAPEKQPQPKQQKEEETPQTAAEAMKPMDPPKPHNDDTNSYPAYVSLTRPGAPTAAPIFKNSDEMQKWQSNEYVENNKYSDKIYSEKVQAWRQIVNWHSVTNMTSITPEEKALGFVKVHKPYYQIDEETRFSALHPTFLHPSDYGYLIPWNSRISTINPDFLALLFHNRADELCKCKNVEEFEKVYTEAAKLHWTYHWESQLREFTPEAALWTMSTKANIWPGKTVVPFQPTPNASEVVVDKRAPKKYEVHGVKRGETGICNVKDLKTLGKKAPIRWYVSPDYLKNMKRFQFIFEENPDPDSDSDGWFGDW
jgi:hypothetical protein